jgi:aqualysin 1
MTTQAWLSRHSRASFFLLQGLVLAAGACGMADRPAQAKSESAQASDGVAAMSLLSPPQAQTAAATAPGQPVMERTPTGQEGQRYIVTLKQPGALSANQIRQIARAAVDDPADGQILYVYTRALRGFAAILTPEAAAELRESGRFAVVPDQWMRATANVQPNPPSWGLDRVDGQLNASYAYDSDGAGVHIYVLDTGIRMTHGDLAGRVDKFVDMIGADGSDPNGHGSHVAGTAAGTTFGLGKQSRVHSVRVLNQFGEGRWTDAIEAIDSVIIRGQKPAVINMSLGGPVYPLADSAIQRAVRAGITVVVAAGNDGLDACDSSPAREPMAITVGATTRTDQFATFSNHGSCVDLLAPGEDIASLGNTADDAVEVMDGTSMASPHVAGAVALYLQAHPGATPAQVAEWLTSSAGTGEITGVPAGTPNRIVRIQPG